MRKSPGCIDEVVLELLHSTGHPNNVKKLLRVQGQGCFLGAELRCFPGRRDEIVPKTYY